MKRLIKRIIPMTMLLVCLLCISAGAATPAKVKNLKAKASGTTVKLSWKKASKAKKYGIFKINTATGQATLYKKTSGTSYTIKNCTSGVTLTFKVCAYSSSGTQGAFSSTVSVTPKAVTPKTPKYFELKAKGDLYVTLKWSKNGSCSGYVIEQYDSASGSYEVVKTINSSSTKEAQIKNLTEGKTYKFRIRSFNKSGGKKIYSAASDPISVKAVKLSDSVKSVRTCRYTVKAKKNVTAKNLTDGGNISITKGTSFTVTSKSSSQVYGYLKDGTYIKVAKSALKYTGLDNTSKDYSTKVKEDYINSKGYASSSDYFIWVSQYTYKVNIFKGSAGNWELVKTYDCIVGKWSTRTSGGLRRILRKIANGEYGGPKIYFTSGTNGSVDNPNGNSFHNYVDKNRTGAKSHGCVRCSKSCLYYIYNNCPRFTSVLIY